MRIFSLSIFICFMALPAAAQNPQEVQRCVWSCQQNTSGNAEYEQCVQRNCTGSTPASHGGWLAGTVDAGTTSFAGVDSTDGKSGIYYFCTSAGRSEIMLPGFTGGSAIFAFEFHNSEVVFPTSFERRAKGLFATIPKAGKLIAALQKFDEVAVTGAGGVGPTFSLKGSSAAFRQALGRC